MLKLFNKPVKHLNPYNQLDNYKGKFSKEKMNDILNRSREKLASVQEMILEEMRKDRSVTSEELKAFARLNPHTWTPEKVKQAMIALDRIRPELSKLTKN